MSQAPGFNLGGMGEWVMVPHPTGPDGYRTADARFKFVPSNPLNLGVGGKGTRRIPFMNQGQWVTVPNPVGPGGFSDLMLRKKFVPYNPIQGALARLGRTAMTEFERQNPKISKVAKIAYRGARALGLIPSMATGGMITAPKRTGKIVRLHDGEMVVPARKVASVVKAARKSKIALPIGALRKR